MTESWKTFWGFGKVLECFVSKRVEILVVPNCDLTVSINVIFTAELM